MKKKSPKTMEEMIGDLARMTKTGFDDVSNRLDDVSGRLDGVEGRLGDVEGAMKEAIKRLDRIEYGMVSHERRLSILEDRVRLISVKVGFKK